MLELRKDISLPGQYYRAGQRHTKEVWKQFFPQLQLQSEWDEWFIDTEMEPDPPPRDAIEQLVDEVFASYHLKSISYKQAAAECVRKYVQLKQL